MQRTSGLSLLLAWLICGCATLYPDTFVAPYGKVQGHDLVLGHFEPEPGDGYYVLLSPEGEGWRVAEIAEAEMAVPPGGERLFVRNRQDGRVDVTIAFDTEVPVRSERTGLYVCDRHTPPDPAVYYSPCRSRFTASALGATERGIDRDDLADVLKKADALAAVDQKLAALDDYARRAGGLHELTTRIDLQITAIDNVPGLIDISPEQLKERAHLQGDVPAEGEAAQIELVFMPLEVQTQAGLVRCELRDAGGKQAILDRGPDDHPVFATRVVVDRCDVFHPRPAKFAVADSTLRAEITEFDASSGKAFISVTNLSKEFVHIDKSSVEYFGEIASASQNFDLPPNANQLMFMPAELTQRDSIFAGATADSARQKAIRFGIAIKYRQGSKGEATLYRAESLSLVDLLGPLPAR